MNFYKRYMGDFSRDTAHLTMLQRGAYNDMLDYYYATGKPLAPGKDGLYRIARAMNGGERKAVDLVADEFFPISGDGLRHNKRADKEIAKHEAQAQINRELGKKGGRPPRTESVSESVSKQEPNREPNDNPNHSQIKPKTNSKEGAAAPPDPLWGEGLQVLIKADMPISSARTFVGKCLKSWTDEQVLDALREARGTADPKAYVLRLLSAKPRKGAKDIFAGAL